MISTRRLKQLLKKYKVSWRHLPILPNPKWTAKQWEILIRGISKGGAKAGLKCPRTPFMSKTKPHCSLSCDTVSNLKLRIMELIGEGGAKDLEIFRLATKLSQAERVYMPPKPIEVNP